MYIPFCDRLMKGKLKQPPLQLKLSKTDLIVVIVQETSDKLEIVNHWKFNILIVTQWEIMKLKKK